MQHDPPTPDAIMRTAYQVLRSFAQVIGERDGRPWDDPDDPIIFTLSADGIQARRLSSLTGQRLRHERGH
jgi:hypothetical protein